MKGLCCVVVRILNCKSRSYGFESCQAKNNFALVMLTEIVLKFFYFKLAFVFKDKFYFEHDLDLEIVKVNLTTSRSMCRVQKVNCFHFYQLWYGP